MTRQTVPDQPKEMKGIWKPTAADSKREGEYLRIEPPRTGKEKFGETFIILEPNGQDLSLPNHTVLQSKMKTLKPGWYVWISFIGKDNKTLLYNVEYDSEYKRQATLNDITDPAGKVLAHLRQAPAGMLDGAFWDVVTSIIGNMADSIKTVDKLKTEGKITQDGSTWRATK